MFRGDNRDQGFTITLAGLAIDLSDAELIFSLKLKETDELPLVELKNEAAGGSDDEIEMTDPANGKFTIHLVPENTSDLQGNVFYWYDIQMVKNSKTLTLIKNKILLKTDITT